MFEHACKVGLEGVVSKVRDSRAALFRKAVASLDNWAEQVASEEPARPGRLAI